MYNVFQRPVTKAPPDCPVRAKAVPLTTLPKRIKDTLSEIERELESKISDDTVRFGKTKTPIHQNRTLIVKK